MPKNRDKVKGALYGVAVGDALGAPVEFMSPEHIRNVHKVLKEMVGGGYLKWKPGEVTDDTQMTLCVARGILKNPDSPFQDIGKEFIRWLDTDPADVGKACRIAISNAKQNGENWASAAQIAEMASGMPVEGNGALMRTIYTPLIYGFKHTEYTKQIARLTHTGPESTRICCEYADLVCRIVNGERYVIKAQKGYIEPTGYVVNTYECALQSVKGTRTFENALISAVNRGGDADTIGAVTGGLAGAISGFSKIPKRWIDAMDDELKRELDYLADEAMKRE